MHLNRVVLLWLAAGLSTAGGQTKNAPVPAIGARETVSISANWRFQMDVNDLGEKEKWYGHDFDRSQWAKATVSKAWDLFDEALWGYEGIGWYAITIPGGLARKDKVQRLNFGRVNYLSRIWLNGERLGENANGYLPFEFDLTGKLKANAANLLVLRVDNRPRLTWLPGAKQIEWIQYGGILEPVTLESSARVYISDVTVNAAPEGPGAAIDCRLAITSRETEEKEAVLRVSVAGDPRAVQRLNLKIAPGATSVETVSLSLAKANRWSPDHPFLYMLAATLQSGGPADRVTQRFGVRKVETRGREILLNGERFIAKGVNRYDEYGKYGPRPPRELLLQDVRRMKSAGVNFVRVHYPQSPDILSLYDELGIAMVEEVTLNWWGNNFSGKGEEVQSEDILNQAMLHLERMIQRDKNHPCVILWSMANESQTSNEVGISVMRKLLRRAKELDGTRLTTFVISPQESDKHRAYEDADVVAVNVYHGSLGGKIAMHMSQFEELVTKASEDYLRRQLAAWPGKPILITEFGGRGVPGVHGDVPYSEDFQAALIRAAWRGIRNCEEVSGAVLWCWADYYHRRTFVQYAVFGPYGVVTVDRRPKAALRALAQMYGGKVVEPPTGAGR
jgi:beta-glucuronidase